MSSGDDPRHVSPGLWLAVLVCLEFMSAFPSGCAQRALARPHKLPTIAMADAARASARAQAVDESDQDRWATLATPVFRTYNQDDGLPNPIATAITEDGDGFLWVGTQGGLSRWDGYRFRNYKPIAGHEGALPDSWITTLHTDPRGRLWIGTSAGGLAMYDRDHDRFACYGGGRGGLSNLNVRAIADDGSGGLWIASDGGLNHLDPASGRITSLRHSPTDAGSLPNDRVFTLVHDSHGALWVGTDGGLAFRRPGSDRFLPVPLSGTRQGPIAVSSLFEDSHGSLWIGTPHDGAFVMTLGHGASPWQTAPIAVQASVDGVSLLAQEWVFSIAQAGPDEIWLGTYGRGVVTVNTQTWQTHGVSRDALVRQSIPNNTIFALHQDRTGAMWVGTEGGLSRMDSSPSGAALTIFGGTSNPHGLSEPNVMSVAAASDGHVWVGLQTKGVDILDTLLGRVTNLKPNSSKATIALPESRVVSFRELQGGTMYMGTTHGLYRTDLSGSRVSRLTLPGRDPVADTRGLTGADGRLWIAGNLDGLWTVVPNGGPRSPKEHFDAGQLTDRRGTILTRGLADDLWIGTRNGLNRLDFATRNIERIVPDRSAPAALAGGQVTGIVFDQAGRLWVSTMGGGVQVLVGRSHGARVFQRITAAQGLPDDNVDGLLADNTGRLWAATDNGIAVIDPKDFSIHTLHRADGVEISAYWAGSAAATTSGELLFGGAGGMTVIRPDRFHPWEYRPKIVMTEAQIGGKPVEAGRFNGPGADHAEPLLVQPDANSLAVEFSALDYSAPERNRYAYWLEGFDRGWTETASNRRVASYTNLPPGKFKLHLRGSNRDGVWTETTLDVPIRVLPAWFQTLWFKMILACIALVSVWALVQSRTIYLRKRQSELEQLVAKRTSELEESKRQIEHVAYHDVLTGLPNRRFFADELRRLTALAARQGHDFALLMLDLDRFKQINDSLGHDAGDALLAEAAKRMTAALRVSDRLLRLGGDEFAILITDPPLSVATERHAVEAVCGRIVDCLTEPFPFQGAEIKTSASVGVAICPAVGNTAETIYKAADLALYEAKRAGRNTWRWHTGAIDGGTEVAEMEARMA